MLELVADLYDDIRVVTPDDIIVDPPADGATVDPLSWFDTPGPFELEIGCGKGGFLLSRARANSEVRLLGIEWANKYFCYCADRMVRWNLSNVRVMRADARHFVINHLPADCIDVLHVYHPDPWPKKRHHKRRLFQPAFVEAVARAVKPGGECLIQSDHAEYFEQITSALGTSDALVPIRWEESSARPGEEWAGTNFEIKYAREGRDIYRAAYRRR